MNCPSCHAEDTRVIDSRIVEEGSRIRRRRECARCHFRFTTIEELEILTLAVVKRDGRTEPYDPDKLLGSIRIAVRKRPFSSHQLRKLFHRLEQEIQTRARRDKISSELIGDLVMKHLRRLDKVSYIRFASVYRSFADVAAFADEVKKFQRKKNS